MVMALKKGFPGILVILLFVLSACQGVPESLEEDAHSGVTLVVFPSRTPTASVTPPAPGSPTPLPSSTPTPRYHTIGRGDTFSGIAFKYGVSIPALQTANPLIDPYILSVGTVVAIPPAEPQVYGTPVIPSPTPIAVELGQPVCFAESGGGLWCFALVTNPYERMIENITGSIRLADKTGQIHDRQAYLPLDILSPGESLPLIAFFPPPVPEPVKIEAEIAIALPVQPGDARYLPARLENMDIQIAADGSSALLNGEVVLEDPGKSAAQIWVAAVAYDSDGVISGVRRWEGGQPMAAGQVLPFSFRVYRSGEAISRVEAFVEARP